MDHIKVVFSNNTQEERDILIAILTEIGYCGFEETEQSLFAYISSEDFSEVELRNSVNILNVSYSLETVLKQNWNDIWESNFDPVVIDDFCTIRAVFHKLEIKTQFDLLITPKMSFGTGHHDTTQMMVKMMRDIGFAGKMVLDFGTGTGVLAILAEKMGAYKIEALDNDEWCIENAKENVIANFCSNILIKNANFEKDDFEINRFDVILANINRQVLIDYLEFFYHKLIFGGQLLMSGLLKSDKEVMEDAIHKSGFLIDSMLEQNNWIAFKCARR